DVHVRPVDLDDVVTGLAVPTQARGRHRAGVDDEEAFELPRIWNMLVPAEHEIDSCVLKRLQCVACVVDDVPLAARPRHWKKMVVEDEDAQVCRLRELLLDPTVAAAADLPVVEIG